MYPELYRSKENQEKIVDTGIKEDQIMNLAFHKLPSGWESMVQSIPEAEANVEEEAIVIKNDRGGGVVR